MRCDSQASPPRCTQGCPPEMCIRDLSPPYGAWGTACSAAGIPARSLRERPIEIHFAPRFSRSCAVVGVESTQCISLSILAKSSPASLRHILLRRAAGVPRRRERNCELSRETPNTGVFVPLLPKPLISSATLRLIAARASLFLSCQGWHCRAYGTQISRAAGLGSRLD